MLAASKFFVGPSHKTFAFGRSTLAGAAAVAARPAAARAPRGPARALPTARRFPPWGSHPAKKFSAAAAASSSSSSSSSSASEAASAARDAMSDGSSLSSRDKVGPGGYCSPPHPTH
jgi:hypothetical protein